MKRMTFKEELAILINKYGLDADTNTPDFILANIACDALASYAGGAVGARFREKQLKCEKPRPESRKRFCK